MRISKYIKEIGLECGIGELNYFSRVFKKLEGVSTSEVRRVWYRVIGEEDG